MGQSDEKGGTLAGLLQLLLLLFALVFVAPGILFMGFFRSASHLPLDLGQMWTFAVVFALGVYGLLAVLYRSAWKGLKVYLILSFLSVLTGVVGHFGFKASWPEALVMQFIP